MFTTILKYALLGALISFLGFTMFFPILLPQNMIDVLNDVIMNLIALDGILPITALLETAFIVVFIVFAWLLFKIFFNILGFNVDE